MTSYLDLPIGDGTPEPITAVIEIPEALGGKDRQIAYPVIQAAHKRYREKHAAA
jgi:hypothetical protein